MPWLSIVYVDAPVWVSIVVRASFKRCAVTWISLSWVGDEAFAVDASAVAAVESAASANTVELVAMKTSAAAPQDAASALEGLDIRITPQKLNECEPLPIARAVHFARQRFSLEREV